MKIINDHTFDIQVLSKEGILVFNAFLFESILENYPDIEISVLTDEINVSELKKNYNACLTQYPTRFSLSVVNRKKRWISINWIKLIALSIRLLFYCLVKKSKINKTKRKMADVFMLPMDAALPKVQIQCDVLFSSALLPNYPYYWHGPHVFLLHDLFTIPLADRFRKVVPDIDSINKRCIDKINDFARSGTFFTNTSEYTRREQLLKYTNVQKEKTAVIPFPPLIKDFDEKNGLNKEDFKKRYNIPGKYMAMPSQNRPNKNWGVVFKALARLKQCGKPFYFVTTGHVADFPDDDRLIKDLGIKDLIIEIGLLSPQELYSLYKYADLVVAPTIIEGLGISGQALEALKVGLPVIHSKSLGIEESLQSVGLTLDTAPLNWFGLDDDETLAIKIQEVLAAPKTHIEKQKCVLSAYLKRTWHGVAESYVKIFEHEIQRGKIQEITQ